MERLTYRDKDGFPMMKKRGGFKRGGVERLAAYEDTWLEPEEITAMRHTLDEYHKVVDPLIRAQADGRLVVLPCKVGDTVYRLFAGNPDNPVIATLKINTVAEAANTVQVLYLLHYGSPLHFCVLRGTGQVQLSHKYCLSV